MRSFIHSLIHWFILSFIVKLLKSHVSQSPAWSASQQSAFGLTLWLSKPKAMHASRGMMVLVQTLCNTKEGLAPWEQLGIGCLGSRIPRHVDMERRWTCNFLFPGRMPYLHPISAPFDLCDGSGQEDLWLNAENSFCYRQWWQNTLHCLISPHVFYLIFLLFGLFLFTSCCNTRMSHP